MSWSCTQHHVNAGELSLYVVLVCVVRQAIARMERFVLEGRKLNGPPAAREVNATLKQRQLEDQYVTYNLSLFINFKRRPRTTYSCVTIVPVEFSTLALS